MRLADAVVAIFQDNHGEPLSHSGFSRGPRRYQYCSLSHPTPTLLSSPLTGTSPDTITGTAWHTEGEQINADILRLMPN